MTATTIDIRGNVAPSAGPGRVGQATAVEQSRAVAEVQAQVIVAQQCPRDVQEALRQMRDSCNRLSMAERAFFRVPRGDKMVSRPSVHLARELARVWGNVQYGTAELRRDDEHKQSEMLAFAWDVQTNSRNAATFIVPHRRDTKAGPKDLSTQQDIYENNANNGARRVREAIFNILPSWFTEEAEQICAKRISEGDGEPMEVRVARCVDRYAKIGVTLAQLEAKTGSKRADWTPNDLAQLGVIFQSIMRNEIRKEDEFDTAAGRTGAADITGPPASNGVTKQEAPPENRSSEPPDPAQASSPADVQEPKRKPLPKTLLGKLKGAVHALPIGDSDAVREAVSALTGRPVSMLEDLRPEEAEQLLAVIDAELEAEQGDTEQAAAGVWRRVKVIQAEQAAPDGGA